jgi:hypothetical protein
VQISYIFISIIFIIVVIWIFIIFIIVTLLFIVELFDSRLGPETFLVFLLTYSLKTTSVAIAAILFVFLVNGSWLLGNFIVFCGGSQYTLHQFFILCDFIQCL